MSRIALLFVAVLACACSIMATTKTEQAVLAALKKDSRTSMYEFEVSVQEDGAVRITGKVGTVAEVDAVTEVAKAVPGVKSVVNNCAVEEPGSNLMQDDYVNAPFL